MINNTTNIINDKPFLSTMNSAENLIPTLSKTASVEYANLFRGLSTFEIDTFPSTIEPKNDKLDQGLNKGQEQEKSYIHLADMVLQHQDLIMNSPRPDNTSASPAKLTRLNTVKGIKVETNHEDDIIHIDRDPIETTSETNLNDSIVDELTKNNNNNKTRSYKTRGINLKRLSTTSTTSSTASSSNVISETKRRGRKPISSNPENNKMSKKQLIIEESKGNMVYFGNKLVEKKTAEYEKRRQNNNQAVKKCRNKLAQEQKEKEEKMKTLNDENLRLNTTVDQLSKELNLLKSIIVKMSPDQKLPEYLDQLIKNMDEDT